MFNNNKNNKAGINDAKIGKNDNNDTGDNKNNKIKKKNLLGNGKKTKENNNNQKIKANTIYLTTLAQADSSKNFILELLDKKKKIMQEIIKIKRTYNECSDCKTIYTNELTDMYKKLAKQQEIREKNHGLGTKEANKYLIGNPPTLLGYPKEIEAKLLNYQDNYLNEYKNFMPKYFLPCPAHNELNSELEILYITFDDYNTLINKNNPK